MCYTSMELQIACDVYCHKIFQAHPYCMSCCRFLVLLMSMLGLGCVTLNAQTVFSKVARTQYMCIECIIAVLIASEKQTGMLQS